MLALSRTHDLPPERPARPLRPSLARPDTAALLLHLAGLGVGAALVLGTTAAATLGLRLVLP